MLKIIPANLFNSSFELVNFANFEKIMHSIKKDLEVAELELEEGSAYGACKFRLNGKVIVFRVAKVTPRKTGQFVAIWKRNAQGVTQPFEEVDDLDFMVIRTRLGNQLGQFVFPKGVLLEHGIITSSKKQGKRGIRVYPPWDKALNRQAEKTQSWQLKCFVNLGEDNGADLDLLKTIFV